MKYIKLTLVIMTSLFLGQCSDKKKADDEKTEAKQEIKEEEPIVLVDIQKIVNKSVSEVGTVWGKAEKTETVEGFPCSKSKCKRVFFGNGKYEVIFKNGKADRITIYKRGTYLEMNERLIESLGLTKSLPSVNNPSTVIRWNNLDGLNEVSFFNNGYDKVDYILIQVTEPE